eukprot:TRINITY_DN51480_c0_g1_i1.p2 TRINITY_DN51480_c0_g1~~TRINITY_DN51480_c0_g1_i1.p2  ORF type:complete len:228 (-),score=52.26 TRINITY_DN51480_c0_g1_i1:492-1175(-)
MQFFKQGDEQRGLGAKRARWKYFNRSLDESETRCASFLASFEDKDIRLLDIGSSGCLFSNFSDLSAVALDLYPTDPRTLRCDFLKVDVSDRVDEPLFSEDGREVMELPAKSFDVAVFSLVLCSVVSPLDRTRMLAKARQLLAEPGLLLIVEVPSTGLGPRGHGAEPGLLKEWQEVIEDVGFTTWRYQHLQKSHALSFITTPRAAGEEASLPVKLRPLPTRLDELGRT